MSLAPDAATARTAPRETTYRPDHPLDLLRTVGVLRRGPWDPTMAVDGTTLWWAHRTPDGIATLALRTVGAEVRATAWGPGAEHALGRFRRCAAPTTTRADSRPPGIRSSQNSTVGCRGSASPAPTRCSTPWPPRCSSRR
ncbi:hypothetical protein [Microbacterium sp. NIBRBAC000506063]|uniref:hypothetical protein n=1 Tax=Microbacterium sp. NIBRBAC000506063 TaxID=2734618 RepID=UPI002948BEA2|nr:hypothetical protein [Microbacterium sp. NIBRBAC000506063]